MKDTRKKNKTNKQQSDRIIISRLLSRREFLFKYYFPLKFVVLVVVLVVVLILEYWFSNENHPAFRKENYQKQMYHWMSIDYCLNLFVDLKKIINKTCFEKNSLMNQNVRVNKSVWDLWWWCSSDWLAVRECELNDVPGIINRRETRECERHVCVGRRIGYKIKERLSKWT